MTTSSDSVDFTGGPICTNIVNFIAECIVILISWSIVIRARSKCDGDALGFGVWGLGPHGEVLNHDDQL